MIFIPAIKLNDKCWLNNYVNFTNDDDVIREINLHLLKVKTNVC